MMILTLDRKEFEKDNENDKVYKSFISNNINMFPGDPTGLPDDFFSGGFL